MPARSAKLEETLKRIQSGDEPDGSRRRKRTSRVLLVVDAVLIVIILMFFYNRQPSDVYQSSTFDYRDARIRFSVTADRASGGYLFGMTLQSRSKNPVTLIFKKAAGTITLRSGGDVIAAAPIGEEFRSIRIDAGQSKSMARIIEGGIIDDFAKTHPDSIKSPKRSLISFEKRHLPLQGELTLNTDPPVTVTLEFKHGVQ